MNAVLGPRVNHSAIGYIEPVDKLNGRDQEIFKERDRKLEKARELRKKKRLRTYRPISPRGDNTVSHTPLNANSLNVHFQLRRNSCALYSNIHQ